MANEMSNEDKIKAVKAWNESGFFHPLTCGNGRCKKVLVAVEEDGEVVLKCDCGYIQKFIPEVVFHHYRNSRE